MWELAGGRKKDSLQVKAPAAEPDGLSSSTKPHMVGGKRETVPEKLSSDLQKCHGSCM